MCRISSHQEHFLWSSQKKNENKKYLLRRRNNKVFLDWMLTAENHVQQNRCYACSRTPLLLPTERQEWLHQPTLEYKIVNHISKLFFWKNVQRSWIILDEVKNDTRLLAMAKWFISLVLCHDSSSFEFMCQLIIAAPDKKICIREPTVQHSSVSGHFLAL